MHKIIPLDSCWTFSRANSPFKAVALPHQAFAEPAVIENPQAGEVVYRCTFEAPEEWRGKIVHMSIGAAMQKTKVFINDRYSFTHFGGYQRFVIPLTDHLLLGATNCVRLEVDNRPSEDMPPGKPVDGMDFCYHSGLYRDASITVYDRIHITDELAVQIPAGGGVFVRTASVEGGTAHLVATCHVLNEIPQAERFDFLGKPYSDGPVTAKMRVYGPDGNELAVADAETVEIPGNTDHTFSFAAEVRNAPLWSCANPQLCRIRFELYRAGELQDCRETTYGIRSFRFTREGFFLNGEKVALFGTNRHMEYPIVGNALTANDQKRDALLMKRGGVNFARLSHYTQHPAFIDACDELGIVVMIPIPGWQYFATNEHFINNAYRDCREMVRVFRNHPSIVLWETSLNESYPPSWINEGLHRIAHEEYPGDQCYTCGDTIGNYEGWDVLFFHDKLANPDKPIIIREFGDWAFGGNKSTSRRTRGDGAKALLGQAWNFQWTFNRLLAAPGVVAGNDWCFSDYNRGCAPGIEASGSVDIFRIPKPKYYFFRSQNCDEPMVYAVRDGAKVVVFSNCDEVELRVGGKPVARHTPDDGPDTPYNKDNDCSPGWETAQMWWADASGGNPYDGGNARNLPHPPFTFTNVPDGDLEAVGYVKGVDAAKYAVRVPGAVKAVRTVVRDEGIAAGEGDLVFVDAELIDENGTVVPEMRSVRFIADGCEILGTSGPAEAGIASCLVRAGKGGAVRVTAEV